MEQSKVEDILDMYEIMGPFSDKTDAWLDARRGGIGGSDVGVVLGMNKWKTPLELFNEKVYGAEPFSSLPAEIGSFLEPFLRKKLFELKQLKCVSRGVGMIPHKTIPFLFANPDDVAKGEHGWCVVEYKTTAIHNKKQWKDGAIPKTYWAQVQLYMQVMRSYFGDEHFDHSQVVVLFGNRDIETRMVARDDYWFDNEALPVLKDFWSTVKSRNPEMFWEVFAVQVDGSSEMTNCVNKAFVPEEKSDEVCELEGGMDALFASYALVKDEFAVAKERFDAVKNKIKVGLKETQKGETGRYYVSWPVVSTSRFDKSSFAADHPELAEKYTKKTASYRGALTVKEK